MATIQRPLKEGSVRTYQQKVALNFKDILASEADGDHDTMYAAWNAGVDTVNIKDGAVTTPKLADLNVTNAKLAGGAVTQDKLSAGSTVAVAQQNSANGGGVVGTTEAVVIELALTAPLIAGRWALIAAQLPCEVNNSSGASQSAQITMNVRYGGTAGVADGTTLVSEIRAITLLNAQTLSVTASATWLLAPSAQIDRVKLTAVRAAGSVTVNTDWSSRLSVVQFA